MSHNEPGTDPIQQFLLTADKLVKEARFVISSFPNADLASVERSLRQLNAVNTVLLNIDDPYLSQGDIEELVGLVNGLISDLEAFRDQDPNPRNFGTSTAPPTGQRGRPRYNLDLQRALELHALNISWEDVAHAMGVGRRTLYDHLERAGISSSRVPYTNIDDDALDQHIADISEDHPLAGAAIIQGHLNARGIAVPRLRVQESLRRVDSIGVMLRWHGAIRRRVYHVRGSNALWHQDGNEKIRPWGFYVHGCVDGHSRLIIYLECSNNKRSGTVGECFKRGVLKYGWPSRVRGDFGTENNEIERWMIKRWGELHRAYLRGRSIHNIRIERLWRDVRKDTLEYFRRIFMYLEEQDLLDMENQIHRVALYLVYQPKIQKSLDETTASWNLHKIRTAGNRTPVAIYELSRETAMREGYWTGDPGDDVGIVDDFYGYDHGEGIIPPADEASSDPVAPRSDHFETDDDAHRAGIFVNKDEEIHDAQEILSDLDMAADDGNCGIDTYCEAVLRLSAFVDASADSL